MVSKNEIVARDKTHLLPDIVRPLKDDVYSYEAALYVAGVDVIEFKEFGSYQGDWWAEVKFPNGEIFYVTGSYGSCPVCDDFEAEFDYYYAINQPDYLHRLRDFGREYLSNCFTLDQAIEEASTNIGWDVDADEMVSWLSGRRRPQPPTSLPSDSKGG